MPQAAALAGRAGEHLQGLGFDLVGVEGAARDTEGVTGRGHAVLVEETKHFKASVGIFGRHVPKMPQGSETVKAPDAMSYMMHLRGAPSGSKECQRFLSLCTFI
jgi:hypothetical protein